MPLSNECTPAANTTHTNFSLALRAWAKDSAEVDIFSSDVLAWVETDSSRREVISRHSALRASLIEKWLKGAGELLDPLLIAGNPPGQDAGGLLLSS